MKTAADVKGRNGHFERQLWSDLDHAHMGNVLNAAYVGSVLRSPLACICSLSSNLAGATVWGLLEAAIGQMLPRSPPMSIMEREEVFRTKWQQF